MRFHAMDDAEGWLKMVVCPAAMLKLCQLSMALLPAVTVNCEPLTVKLAEPLCTVRPVGFASASRMSRKNTTPGIRRPSAIISFGKKDFGFIFIKIERRPRNRCARFAAATSPSLGQD